MGLSHYILLVICINACVHNSEAEDVELFEGDMAMSEETKKVIEGRNFGYKAAFHWKWPNNIIPYHLNSSLDKVRIGVVKKAFAEFEKVTCLKFIPRTNEFNYLNIELTNKGCWSWIGIQKHRKGQSVSIGWGCQYVFVVMHELMHAIGFFHEQSRLDRDNFVKINYQNIQNGQDYNFKKYGKGYADTYGEKYDLFSLMHYRKTEFSKNGRNTIEAKTDSSLEIGNTKGFSPGDIRQINRMYGCKK